MLWLVVMSNGLYSMKVILEISELGIMVDFVSSVEGEAGSLPVMVIIVKATVQNLPNNIK